jgi:hypothetical protein
VASSVRDEEERGSAHEAFQWVRVNFPVAASRTDTVTVP